MTNSGISDMSRILKDIFVNLIPIDEEIGNPEINFEEFMDFLRQNNDLISLNNFIIGLNTILEKFLIAGDSQSIQDLIELEEFGSLMKATLGQSVITFYYSRNEIVRQYKQDIESRIMIGNTLSQVNYDLLEKVVDNYIGKMK